ncbi:type VI secretion system protein TssA [Marinobacterium jannaschii]|uniref:type VI secretion system protein TssA n=1 Tax=Marinobacterium jannaschii TaxID=64970 RepID=UPI0006845229|nr:type VI secretion system ImpA family N-terminal domain-containing protein [Marinobacterium jannaschii]
MEHLLNPINDDAPCGEYLKGNRSLYRGLRNSFNMAQSSFRQLIESPDATADDELLQANQDNWQSLAQQCEETLTDTSKDVEVFCWLATAQLFGREPLAGLADVLETFAEAVERFWPDLNPKPPENKLKAEDDSDRQREWAEHRIKPLLQLVGDTQDSGLLYMPLQMIPLIGEIDYARYFSAERKGELAQLKAEAEAALAAERAVVTETIIALGRALEALQLLESRIAEHCRNDGAEGMSFRFVRESIERLINALRYLLGDQLQPWPLDKVEDVEVTPDAAEAAGSNQQESVSAEDTTAATEAQADTAVSALQAAGTTVSLTPGGEIYCRDQAFQELRRIADYFQRTEPHSPVYMLLERAIRWGYMSLPELLNEMVGENGGVMGRITQLAGLESIEKTDIPEARIDPGLLTQPQAQVTAAMVAPVAAPVIAPAMTVPEQPVVVSQPAAPAPAAVIGLPDEPAAGNNNQTSGTDPDNAAGQQISSFEW